MLHRHEDVPSRCPFKEGLAAQRPSAWSAQAYRGHRGCTEVTEEETTPEPLSPVRLPRKHSPRQSASGRRYVREQPWDQQLARNCTEGERDGAVGEVKPGWHPVTAWANPTVSSGTEMAHPGAANTARPSGPASIDGHWVWATRAGHARP